MCDIPKKELIFFCPKYDLVGLVFKTSASLDRVPIENFSPRIGQNTTFY